jgi:gamma-glutamylcysteine synthetase
LGSEGNVLLISNFRRVLYVVCFLLGNSPASEEKGNFEVKVSEEFKPLGKCYAIQDVECKAVLNKRKASQFVQLC